jgi:hypothetical protein
MQMNIQNAAVEARKMGWKEAVNSLTASTGKGIFI